MWMQGWVQRPVFQGWVQRSIQERIQGGSRVGLKSGCWGEYRGPWVGSGVYIGAKYLGMDSEANPAADEGQRMVDSEQVQGQTQERSLGHIQR